MEIVSKVLKDKRFSGFWLGKEILTGSRLTFSLVFLACFVRPCSHQVNRSGFYVSFIVDGGLRQNTVKAPEGYFDNVMAKFMSSTEVRAAEKKMKAKIN